MDGAPPRDTRGTVTRRAALWLAFLAPFFYATYGASNWLAAQRDGVGAVVFDWEHAVPFLAWTIVPYWSINLFYAASLFVNDSRQGVDRLAGRYLTAQVVAVACFLAFPLMVTFARPQTDGLPGFLFEVLGGFDMPYNQAPSLHIALLVIIWDHLRHRLPAGLLPVWHAWCALIAVSVLTTWQHHFIDMPTGLLLGVFALWLFPREGATPFAGLVLSPDPKARKLAARYGAGAVLLLAGAAFGAFFSPLWLLLLWPALAVAIVAFGYAGAGAKVFQKRADGTVSLASRWLLLPVRLGARINAHAWTRGLPACAEVAAGVHLGRLPGARDAAPFAAVVDLTAELARPARAAQRWTSVPMLDLVQPPRAALAAAAAAIEEARAHGPVLVCCALGFQRSAEAIAGWLTATGRAKDRAAARAVLEGIDRPVVLLPEPAPEAAR